MQFLQEFSLRQGVGGSQSGLGLGFVLEFWYIGGWGGAGLGMEEVEFMVSGCVSGVRLFGFFDVTRNIF
jgi:hypothetical protein